MTPDAIKARGAATAADAARIANMAELIRFVASATANDHSLPALAGIEEAAAIVAEIAGRIAEAHEDCR